MKPPPCISAASRFVSIGWSTGGNKAGRGRDRSPYGGDHDGDSGRPSPLPLHQRGGEGRRAGQEEGPEELNRGVEKCGQEHDGGHNGWPREVEPQMARHTTPRRWKDVNWTPTLLENVNSV